MTDWVVMSLSVVRDAAMHVQDTATPFLMVGVVCGVASLWAYAKAQGRPRAALERSAVRALAESRRPR